MVSVTANTEKKKKPFSGSIWDKSVIQTVKCSLFVDINFNESLYDALWSLANFSAGKSFVSRQALASPL